MIYITKCLCIFILLLTIRTDVFAIVRHEKHKFLQFSNSSHHHRLHQLRKYSRLNASKSLSKMITSEIKVPLPTMSYQEFYKKYYGTKAGIEELKKKFGPNGLGRARTSTGVTKKLVEIKKATDHLLKVRKEARCNEPQPRVVKIQDEHPDVRKEYIPRCTVLYRCSDDTGCCDTDEFQCTAKSWNYVDLHFYTFTLNINTETQTSSNDDKVEILSLKNHTKCECQPAYDIPRTTNGRHSPSFLKSGRSRANPQTVANPSTTSVDTKRGHQIRANRFDKSESIVENFLVPGEVVGRVSKDATTDLPLTQKNVSIPVTRPSGSGPVSSKIEAENVSIANDGSKMSLGSEAEPVTESPIKPSEVEAATKSLAFFSDDLDVQLPVREPTKKPTTSVRTSLRPMVTTGLPVIEPATQIRRLEWTTKSPNFNSRCRDCPVPFNERPYKNGGCSCDCFDKQRECIRIKRGKDHLAETERRCVEAKYCHEPECEFGEYLPTYGRCPKRREMKKRKKHAFKFQSDRWAAHERD